MMTAEAAPGRARPLGTLVAGLLLTSALASAARAEEITVWWDEGFFQAEDQAIHAVIQAWQKQTGNTVILSFYSTGDIASKIISAIRAGQFPDICYADINGFVIA